MNFSVLDRLEAPVIHSEQSFVIRRGGHPRFVQYIEPDRKITLAWDWEDLTSQLGRTWLFFRTFGRIIKTPLHPKWDGDKGPMTEAESTLAFERICRAMTRAGSPCRTVVDDRLYQPE